MMDLSDEESFMNGSSNEQTAENVFEKDELGNDNLQQLGSKTLKREPAHRFVQFASTFAHFINFDHLNNRFLLQNICQQKLQVE